MDAGSTGILTRHKTLITAASGVALTVLVAWTDYVTGIELSFSIFYLIPVSLTAWLIGLYPGIAVAVLCSVGWFLMDHIAGGHHYSSPLIPYWNALVRLGFFGITAYSISTVNELLIRERRSSMLKSDMVSMVSHEFNNALASLSLASTLLQEEDGEDIPEQRRKLYTILDQTQKNMMLMVKNLLNKARMDAGKFRLQLQPTELRKIVREVLDAIRPMSYEKNLRIETDFPETVHLVEVDPDAMALAINNLIGNAIKYTGKNGRIVIAIAKPENGAQSLLFSVSDTGIGIREEDLKAILSGFYRTDSGKAVAKGFGIGLKITSELLTAHGSRLNIASKVGEGSRFSFTLPIYKGG